MLLSKVCGCPLELSPESSKWTHGCTATPSLDVLLITSFCISCSCSFSTQASLIGGSTLYSHWLILLMSSSFVTDLKVSTGFSVNELFNEILLSGLSRPNSSPTAFLDSTLDGAERILFILPELFRLFAECSLRISTRSRSCNESELTSSLKIKLGTGPRSSSLRAYRAHRSNLE